jgi:hypothetical protein
MKPEMYQVYICPKTRFILQYTRQKSAFGTNTSTQLVSFKIVPNTSSSQVWEKIGPPWYQDQLGMFKSWYQYNTGMYLCDGWWSSPMIDTLYHFPPAPQSLPPNMSMQDMFGVAKTKGKNCTIQ